MRIQLTYCGFRLQITESTYSLRIPLTNFGFHLQLRLPRQLKFTKHIYYCLLMDSTHSVRIPHMLMRIPQSCLFLSKLPVFEQFLDSATNLNFACCGFCLQFTKSPVWPVMYHSKIIVIDCKLAGANILRPKRSENGRSSILECTKF